MALISCPECEKQVSDHATACPFCGYPIKQSDPVRNEPSKVVTEQSDFLKKNRGCADMILYAPLIGILSLVFLFLVATCTK